MDQITAEKVAGLTPMEANVRYLSERKIPQFDTEGQPTGELILVRYQCLGEFGSVIEDRWDHLMTIPETDDPDHAPTNMVKARAIALMQQREAKLANERAVLPHGHTTLESWGALSPTHIAALKAHDIHTLEQLRDAKESRLALIPSGINVLNLRESARAYLDSKRGMAASEALEEIKAENAKLSDLVNRLLEKLADKELAEEAPKRRGRPPAAVGEEAAA